MYLQEKIIRRKSKTYRYVQLVESYRRKKDGMPTHRVIGNLGNLPAQVEQNLRLALKASRNGHAVIVAPDSPGLTEAARDL